MSTNTHQNYYQRNRDYLLNKAREYYKNLSEEEKNKKTEYIRNKSCNMTGEQKEKKNMQKIGLST